MSTKVTVSDVPGGKLAVWAALGGAESGDGVSLLGTVEKVVQVSGTFGSASVAVQGSNDGSTWFPLTDGSAAIAITSAGGKRIAESPVYLRAVSTGGTGSNLKVSIAGSNRR